MTMGNSIKGRAMLRTLGRHAHLDLFADESRKSENIASVSGDSSSIAFAIVSGGSCFKGLFWCEDAGYPDLGMCQVTVNLTKDNKFLEFSVKTEDSFGGCLGVLIPVETMLQCFKGDLVEVTYKIAPKE